MDSRNHVVPAVVLGVCSLVLVTQARAGLPTISIDDITLDESSCEGPTFVFTVTLSHLGRPVTVSYATSDGSPGGSGTAAVAGKDYVPTSGTLAFDHSRPPNGPGGSYLRTITVPLGNHVVSSGNNDGRAFTVTLSGATNATIGKPQGVGTMANAATSCAAAQDTECFVSFCGAATACRNVNRSAAAEPYCKLAGLGTTPQPDPDFAACKASGEWIDSDGDGFSDAEEIQGYIDVNGNGVYDPGTDVPLPGADPRKPDVYLHYDYSFARDHSHNPPPEAIQWVVDAFAAHGVNLHIDPQHNAINESTAKVVTNQFADNPDPACVGPSAVTMHQLRQTYFPPNFKLAYHYMVFSHWSSCDSPADCARCPADPACGGGEPPPFGALGSAAIGGDDAIVSLGPFVDAAFPLPAHAVAGLTMHELGHNLALRHGGSSCDNLKPNYLSVMSYSFNTIGIPVGAAPGDNVPKSCASDEDCTAPAHCSGPDGFIPNTCFRIDYSGEKLPDLNEFSPSSGVGGLDETKGLGGSPTSTDISWYSLDGFTPIFVPTNGSPIDWNQDGTIETHVTQDINLDMSTTLLAGSNDWAVTNGLFTSLDFSYQCTNNFAAAGGAGAGLPAHATGIRLRGRLGDRRMALEEERAAAPQGLPR